MIATNLTQTDRGYQLTSFYITPLISQMKFRKKNGEKKKSSKRRTDANRDVEVAPNRDIIIIITDKRFHTE